MNGQDQKIEVRPGTLGNLLSDVEKGRYRIPKFQREYVWRRSKVVELLDSIYQEYPIGSFFLWKAPREYNRLFRGTVELGIPPVDKHDDVSFVLDGQQRITSLYVTLNGMAVNGVDYRKISFDLKEEKFLQRASDNRRYIAVFDIWGPKAISVSRQIDEDLLPTFDRCFQTLKTYPISIVEVRDNKDLPAVCRIFQRINQSGKRLDRFDLVAATTFTPTFDLRERFKKDIQEKLEEKRFGKIQPFVLTQLLALIKTGRCTERNEFDLTADDIQKNWDSAVKSILLAADTLRNNMGVAKSAFLPYEAFITLLAYYFHKSGKRALSASHLDWVQNWFWKASFAAHYGSGGPTKLGNDRELFDSLIEDKAEEFKIPINLTVDNIIRTRMNVTSSALRNAFLCLLSLQGPTSLSNNAPLDLKEGGLSDFTNPEKHHIFPKAFLKKNEYEPLAIQSLANFCFLTAELNNHISDSDPAEYFEELRIENPNFETAAKASLLPLGLDSGIQENDYLKFLHARGKIILEEVRRLCGSLSAPREDEQQQVIKGWEDRLRDLIHTTLEENVGPEYWKTNIPSHIQDGIQERIKAELSKFPDKKQEDFKNPRARLDFCNVMDYPTIMEARTNWPFFEQLFRKKEDLKSHFSFFNDFRNHVMHGREMSDLVKSRGETALVWLATVMPDSSEEEELADSD